MKRFLLMLILLSLPVFAEADSVKLCCWIVGDGNGVASFTSVTVSNLVQEINQIYRQVVLTFEIDSLSYTNDTYLSDLVYTNSVQRNAICSITNNTGGLELYFIHSIVGRATAFRSSDGIVIGPRANARTIAHEIGHACNLCDIYDSHRGTSLAVAGFPSKGRMPDDWGWYPSTVTHAEVVKRLLMYGYRSDVKADISYGDIYGLHYTNSWNAVTRRWDRVWFLDNAPIGFGTHGNRNPMSQ